MFVIFSWRLGVVLNFVGGKGFGEVLGRYLEDILKVLEDIGGIGGIN